MTRTQPTAWRHLQPPSSPLPPPAPVHLARPENRTLPAAWTVRSTYRKSKLETSLDLTQNFGFQRDSIRNRFNFLIQLLDPRALCISHKQALTTQHTDYISVPHAKYSKRYFAAQLN
ncbi:hypothetical protein RhiJN_18694 [Ceratobasidium sp. AG-Ba]|nr:hypothetical protein RhiJN_18694 [Ceratobasidium sp. AG-Ba]